MDALGIDRDVMLLRLVLHRGDGHLVLGGEPHDIAVAKMAIDRLAEALRDEEAGRVHHAEEIKRLDVIGGFFG